MGHIKESLTDERLEFLAKLYDVYKQNSVSVPDFWMFVEQRTKYIDGNRSLHLKKVLEKMMEEGYYEVNNEH